MDKNELERYLFEAEGKDKSELSLENPYREIGFDGEKKRLGWVRNIPFLKIKQYLEKILEIIGDKENFIFVGMGGSINGIKVLLSLFKEHSLYALDNLDPAATEQILTKIKNIDKTLIIPISKSGTTKETQLLSFTLKELFKKESRREHFLMLSDPASFTKLDSLGWSGAKKLPIQFDGEADIGGRFSCPHTLIFFFPLFLLLNRDFGKLQVIYQTYISHQEEIRNQAYCFTQKYKEKKSAYFYPVVKKSLQEVFSSWCYQIFQESLGGKKEGFSAKTIVFQDKNDNMFLPLELNLTIDNSAVYIMCQMYFFQIFIAFYAAAQKVNFVNQDFVEKYKNVMKKLEAESPEEIVPLKLDHVIEEVQRKIDTDCHFIEVVLYFYPRPDVVCKIKDTFRGAFKDRRIFTVVGSDWNHHSYQATFGDENTFYVFLLSSAYLTELFPISVDTLSRNIETLKLISKATHSTLADKSLLFSLSF